jgi:uncharacterized protein
VTEPVLLDTGPLVAILSATDEYHERCVDVLKTFRQRPVTCWPVLTESAWLLRTNAGAVAKMFAHMHAGLFELAEIPAESGDWLSRFLLRYSDLPAQLADAALVYLAETRRLETVFTLDRRDFAVYRTTDNRTLSIVL